MIVILEQQRKLENVNSALYFKFYMTWGFLLKLEIDFDNNLNLPQECKYNLYVQAMNHNTDYKGLNVFINKNNKCTFFVMKYWIKGKKTPPVDLYLFSMCPLEIMSAVAGPIQMIKFKVNNFCWPINGILIYRPIGLRLQYQSNISTLYPILLKVYQNFWPVVYVCIHIYVCGVLINT